MKYEIKKKKEFDLTEFDRKEAELQAMKSAIDFCVKQANYYITEEKENGEIGFDDNYDFLRYEAFTKLAEKLMKEACK